MCIPNRWVRLPRAWKTEQASQVIYLLKGYHIRAKTLPDEFNGLYGNSRIQYMDSEAMWSVFVRADKLSQAVRILKAEELL